MLLDKLNIILNSSDEFSPKYIISSFVKNNLYEIPSMSIDAIALSCNTSKSQISKYVKSLGYETMKDFKEDCLDNISGMERTNKTLFSLQNSIIKQYTDFTTNIIDELHFTMNQIDEINLLKLVSDLKKSKRIFVYGHGHARTLCTYIQNELSTKQKETIICDLDFKKEYHFQDTDFLLLISINGDTFHFNKRVIHHILKYSVNTWLISCKDHIDFPKNYLYIPTTNDKYNDYLLRHIIDFILMY